VAQIAQFLSYKPHMAAQLSEEGFGEFISEHGFAGSEVFASDFAPRESALEPAHIKSLKARFDRLRVKRLHASYWGWPAAYLAGEPNERVLARLGGPGEIAAYYGGGPERCYERWAAEYRLACEIGAESFVFHMIDYAPIDGLWEYEEDNEAISEKLADVLRRLLDLLKKRGLYSKASPVVELENAGWGLEYGLQTAAGFSGLFSGLDDPYEKVKIGWDTNHLLHALGYDARTCRARFFLPSEEKTAKMAELEESLGAKPKDLAAAWIASQALGPSIAGRVSCLHISDGRLKSEEFFRRGKLTGPYREEQAAMASRLEMEEYGERLVLREYDSHLPIGDGILDMRFIDTLAARLASENEGFCVLHELKNMPDPRKAVLLQSASLLG